MNNLIPIEQLHMCNMIYILCFRCVCFCDMAFSKRLASSSLEKLRAAGQCCKIIIEYVKSGIKYSMCTNNK